MKIKINGKAHLSGTSKKTGKPYNIVQLHYLGHARGVEGLASRTVNIDPSLIDYESIVCGKEYDIECDLGGYVISVKPAF